MRLKFGAFASGQHIVGDAFGNLLADSLTQRTTAKDNTQQGAKLDEEKSNAAGFSRDVASRKANDPFAVYDNGNGTVGVGGGGGDVYVPGVMDDAPSYRLPSAEEDLQNYGERSDKQIIDRMLATTTAENKAAADVAVINAKNRAAANERNSAQSAQAGTLSAGSLGSPSNRASVGGYTPVSSEPAVDRTLQRIRYVNEQSEIRIPEGLSRQEYGRIAQEKAALRDEYRTLMLAQGNKSYGDGTYSTLGADVVVARVLAGQGVGNNDLKGPGAVIAESGSTISFGAAVAGSVKSIQKMFGGNGTDAPWKGSGPVPGTIGISPETVSSQALQNYKPKKGYIEFIFDPDSSTFVVGRPKQFLPGYSPHENLAKTIGADPSRVVGGMFTRDKSGVIMTNEFSGHYWQNWKPEIRTQFVQTMESKNLKVIHSEGM